MDWPFFHLLLILQLESNRAFTIIIIFSSVLACVYCCAALWKIKVETKRIESKCTHTYTYTLNAMKCVHGFSIKLAPNAAQLEMQCIVIAEQSENSMNARECNPTTQTHSHNNKKKRENQNAYMRNMITQKKWVVCDQLDTNVCLLMSALAIKILAAAAAAAAVVVVLSLCVHATENMCIHYEHAEQLKPYIVLLPTLCNIRQWTKRVGARQQASQWAGIQARKREYEWLW